MILDGKVERADTKNGKQKWKFSLGAENVELIKDIHTHTQATIEQEKSRRCFCVSRSRRLIDMIKTIARNNKKGE